MRRFVWLLLVVATVVEPAPSRSSSVDGGGGGVAGGGGGGGEPAGGVLRIGVTPLGNLDPSQARSIEQVLVADQLFDSLTAFDPATLEPQPSLAAWWEASPDQRQWTFHLRPGAVFANGRAVTAVDVKYSLERVARRGSGSPGAELLQVVSGYGDFRNGGTELAGVTTPAVDVVGIALDEPLAVLPAVLASPVLAVVPRESAEAQPPEAVFGQAPVGSGPFRLDSNDGRVLTLFPAPGARTGVGRLDVVQYENVSDAYRAFTRGELDWARVPPEQSAAAARRYGTAAFRPYVAELFYGFNLESPKLADARFREAIVRAVDRRAVVAAVYQGAVRAADGVVLDGVPGHQPQACGRCGYDPGRARRLLAEAFGDGAVPEVALDYDDDPGQEALARAVQAALGEVGITVALRPRPVDAYDQVALSGEQEIFRLGWVAAYPSPDAFLAPLFRSDSVNNLTGFSDPAVDELLRRARAEPDRAVRLGLYQEAERAVMDHVPLVPIGQFELHAVVADRVRNLVATSLGTFDASAVSLAGR